MLHRLCISSASPGQAVPGSGINWGRLTAPLPPQLRPRGPGRARGNGATCWRRCAPQDPPRAGERGRSRHHVPAATARPAAQGKCHPRHILGVRTQPESSLEVPWGGLGSEVPRKARGSGRLCSVFVQLSACALLGQVLWSWGESEPLEPNSSRWKPGWAIPVGLSALVTHRRALGPGLWALNYSPLSEFPVAIAMLLRRDGKPSGGAQTRQTFTMLFPALTRWDND